MATFNTADRMQDRTQVVQQVVEGLDALPTESAHQHSDPPTQLQSDDYFHVSMGFENNYLTQPDNYCAPDNYFTQPENYLTQPDRLQNIPRRASMARRASMGRSASMAQTVHKISRQSTQEDWESLKEHIFNIYIVENHTLKDVRSILSTVHGFKATERQLRERIMKWEFQKNRKKSHTFIIGKPKQRADDQGEKSVLRVRGLEATQEALQEHEAVTSRANTPSKTSDWTPPAFGYEEQSITPLIERETSLSSFLAETNPADGPNLSSHYQTAARNYTKSQDDRTASRSLSIGSVYSVLENLHLSPQAENSEYSELLSDETNMFSADSQFPPRTEPRENSLDSDMFSIPDSSDDVELFDCQERAYPILKIMFHQLLAGYQTATEYHLSPGAGDTTSGPVTSTTESAPIETTPRPCRKRNLLQDEEDETGEDESRQQRPKKIKLDQDDEAEKSFACPFLKWNPITYSRCCVKKLNSISYVKQHLHRQHTPERYCQTCHSSDFPDDDNLQNHIHIGTCTCRSRTMLDGISYQQRFKLSRKSKRKSSKENQWYAIWDILFPGDRQPSSIYVDTDLALEMRQFREYCERYGPVIMREQMESDPAWLSSGTTVEHRRVLDSLIACGLNTLFDNWGSRNSSASTRPESQNNDNLEQSLYETPTNSLVDSGVMMGAQPSSTETSFESSELTPPSMILAAGSAALLAAAETRARDFSPVQAAPLGPDPINIQSLSSASPTFTAGSQDWEIEYPSSGFEVGPQATFEHDFNFGAFSSLEDMLGYYLQPGQSYSNVDPL